MLRTSSYLAENEICCLGFPMSEQQLTLVLMRCLKPPFLFVKTIEKVVRLCIKTKVKVSITE